MIASNSASSSANEVSIRQARSGSCERSSRQTETPSPSGSRTSSTATSGRSAGTRASASAAVAASPTTTMSPSASSRSCTPRRTTSWSSSRKTRIGAARRAATSWHGSRPSADPRARRDSGSRGVGAGGSPYPIRRTICGCRHPDIGSRTIQRRSGTSIGLREQADAQPARRRGQQHPLERHAGAQPVGRVVAAGQQHRPSASTSRSPRPAGRHGPAERQVAHQRLRVVSGSGPATRPGSRRPRGRPGRPSTG